MTDLRAAAQQALEALKSCSGVPHWPALQPTIDALRAALAQEQAGSWHDGVLERRQAVADDGK